MLGIICGMFRDQHHGKPCPYCKRTMDRASFHLQPTRDHVIPASRGGRTKIICCHKCNGIKADMMPGQWELYMAENPGWWLLSKAERRARSRAERRAYDFPNKKGNVVRSRRVPPIVVPKELIYGHSKEGHSDRVAAVVGAPAEVEAGVLEEGA